MRLVGDDRGRAVDGLTVLTESEEQALARLVGATFEPLRAGEMCPACRTSVLRDCECGAHTVCVGCDRPPWACECLGAKL